MNVTIDDIIRDLENNPPEKNAELISHLAYGMTQMHAESFVHALKHRTRQALPIVCVQIWTALSRANLCQFMAQIDDLVSLLEPAVPHAIEQIEDII